MTSVGPSDMTSGAHALEWGAHMTSGAHTITAATRSPVGRPGACIRMRGAYIRINGGTESPFSESVLKRAPSTVDARMTQSACTQPSLSRVEGVLTDWGGPVLFALTQSTLGSGAHSACAESGAHDAQRGSKSACTQNGASTEQSSLPEWTGPSFSCP